MLGEEELHQQSVGAAVILAENGIDVGIKAYDKFENKEISFLCTKDDEYKSFITDGEVRMLSVILEEGAEPLLFASEPKGKQIIAYRYENPNGERFLVFLFEE